MVAGGLRKSDSAYSRSIFKTISSLLQFAVVCSSSSHLHLVSKITENPWGQIWVTVLGAGQGAFMGHSGSRLNWKFFEQGSAVSTNSLLFIRNVFFPEFFNFCKGGVGVVIPRMRFVFVDAFWTCERRILLYAPHDFIEFLSLLEIADVLSGPINDVVVFKGVKCEEFVVSDAD